jgi:hypothetical protein
MIDQDSRYAGQLRGWGVLEGWRFLVSEPWIAVSKVGVVALGRR